MAAQTGQDVASRRVDLDVRTERDTSEVGVRYFDAGTGGDDEGKPPVVLLHGIGLDAAAISWKRVVPVLARDQQVLALDFPGHGVSDKPARSYTTPYYAGVLDAFLDSIDVERAALVGISMGGGIALGRALDSPERVLRLVLVDSHGLGRDAPWRAPGFLSLWMPGFDSLLTGSLRDPATVSVGLRAMTVDPDPEFLADVCETVTDGRTVRALTNWQRSEFGPCGLRTCYLDQVDELSVPTLLVHGRDDPVFPVTWSARADERIETSSFEPIEACGHWPPRERPAVFNRLVSDFLESEGDRAE